MDSKVEIPRNAKAPPVEYLSAILAEAARYPASWVIAAERWQSLGHDEPELERIALDGKWLPKVPRL
jgi:hypothetical protein